MDERLYMQSDLQILYQSQEGYPLECIARLWEGVQGPEGCLVPSEAILCAGVLKTPRGSNCDKL